MEPRQLVSIPGTAEQLDIGVTSVYALAKSGRLRKVKLGRRGLITQESINALVRDLLADGPSSAGC